MLVSRTVRGFTLIELLVVISIIGMLSSVIFGSVQSARDKARIAAGIKFERHTYGALSQSVIAKYEFEDQDQCDGDNYFNRIKNSTLNAALDIVPALGDQQGGTCNDLLIENDTPTQEGTSLKLGWINNYINANEALSLETPLSENYSKLSVGFWIKAPSFKGQYIVIDIDSSSANNYEISFANNFNATNNVISIAGDIDYVSNPNMNSSAHGDLADNKWHYVFLSFGPDIQKMYIDGTLINSAPLNGVMPVYTDIDNIDFNNIGSLSDLLIDNLTIYGDAI